MRYILLRLKDNNYISESIVSNSKKHNVEDIIINKIELTKKDLKNIYSDTTSFKVKDKIWKVLDNENKNS